MAVAGSVVSAAPAVVWAASAASAAALASRSGGRRTLSITWTMPSLAIMSARITDAPFTSTPSAEAVTSTSAPLTVVTAPDSSDALRALAGTKWYVRMETRVSKSSARLSGSASKASSVGAGRGSREEG